MDVVNTVAAIDCGTNSIRLLIARADAHSGLTDVVRDMRVVRLGQGVDRTGRFDPAALQRTLEAVDAYAAACREFAVDAVRFVATSATRDAANRDEFLSGVRERLGVEAEVISGEEEASLSFRGAVRGCPEPPAEGVNLVVDLGGGSTELVTGLSAPEAAYSMNVGCVRLTERHQGAGAQIAEAVAADVRAALDVAEQRVDLSRVGRIIGVAGTITTVTAHALGLEAYDRDRINGARVPFDRIIAAARDLAELGRDERAALGFMHPGRVDVVGTGSLIWIEVLRRVRERVPATRPLELVTSEYDILDGIALSLV